MGGAFFSFPWTDIGTIDATAAAADAALGVSERTREIVTALDNGVVYDIPQGTNALLVQFVGGTNGHNHVVDVWAGKRRDLTSRTTDLCRVCTLDVETGSQVEADTALLFADEITLTNEAWPKDIRVVQSGNDTELVARLFITDMCGYDVIAFHGHTAGFASDLHVEVSGFSNFFDLVPA